MSQKPNDNAERPDESTPSSAPTKRAPTVIVPLDGTVNATVALPVAKVLAEIEGATLHIVHVGEPILPPCEVLHKLQLTSEDLLGSVIDQSAGQPAQSIARLAQERQSRLIVICTHTGATKARGKLGSVARGLLQLAPCPVVLVQPERGIHPWALSRILLPHDGTPSMAAAIGPAADLARRAGVELLVLYVGEPGTARPAEPGTFAGPRYLDQPQHEWPAWAREFLERLRGSGHPPKEVKLRLFLAKGEPGEEIVRFATERNTDLIVLGWHGHLEAERAVTLKKVMGGAPCPVLVVRVET